MARETAVLLFVFNDGVLMMSDRWFDIEFVAYKSERVFFGVCIYG